MLCSRSSSMRIILLALLLSSSLLFAQRPLHSIDVTDLDRKADPCTDFFQYANGTWRANNPIPASMMRWSKRWQAGESAKDRLKDILEAASTNKDAPQGSTEQIIGDYYGACMDESRVNARGMEPIKPWFAKIDAARDIGAVQRSWQKCTTFLFKSHSALAASRIRTSPHWRSPISAPAVSVFPIATTT